MDEQNLILMIGEIREKTSNIEKKMIKLEYAVLGNGKVGLVDRHQQLEATYSDHEEQHTAFLDLARFVASAETYTPSGFQNFMYEIPIGMSGNPSITEKLVSYGNPSITEKLVSYGNPVVGE